MSHDMASYGPFLIAHESSRSIHHTHHLVRNDHSDTKLFRQTLKILQKLGQMLLSGRQLLTLQKVKSTPLPE